jgi:hypothetical protein
MKYIAIMGLMVMSYSAFAEDSNESIDPKDMSLGFPIGVVDNNIFDLADKRDYGTQPNGSFILEKSALRKCLGNYFYIHLGDEQYRSYEDDLEKDRNQIMKDKLIIEEFEMQVDHQGSLAKSKAEVEDYNDKVKIFNELTIMQSGHLRNHNDGIERLNNFGNIINKRTRRFAKMCNTRNYYNDEYQELILTVKEEMFDEFDRALKKLN